MFFINRYDGQIQVPADFQPKSKAFRDRTAYYLKNRYFLINRLALRKAHIKLIQAFDKPFDHKIILSIRTSLAFATCSVIVTMPSLLVKAAPSKE